MDIESGNFSSDIGFTTTGTMTTSASNGGFINLSGTINGNLTASNIWFNGDTLAGNFSVSGTMYWLGGTISGVVTVPTGGEFILECDNALTLTGTLNNSGVVTTDTNNSFSVTLQLSGQGQINNLTGGLFSETNSYSLNVSGTTDSVFTNAGTLRCSGGYGAGIYFTSTVFNNSGLVDVESGDFSSDIGFTTTGTMSTSASNGGFINLSGTINGNLTASNIWFNGDTLAGNFSVSGTMYWLGGTISGVVTVPTGGEIILEGNNALTLTGTLNNSGVVTASGATLQLLGAGLVNNQTGGLVSNTGSGILTVSGTTNSAFINAGTLLCTSYGGIYFTSTVFNNTGLVDIEAGNFNSDIGFTNDGTMTTSASSGGFINLSGTINGNLTASNIWFNGDTLAGNFSVSGTMYWLGGTISGVVTVPTGGEINLECNNALTLTGTLNNSGVVTTDTNNSFSVTLQLSGQGQINNLTGGLFSCVPGLETMNFSLNISGTTNSSFTNAGTLLCTSGEGITFINTDFNNTGLVDAEQGLVSFNNSFSQSAGSLRLSGSGGSVQSSQPIQISGGTIVGSGTIDASVVNTGGTVQPGNQFGSLVITGSYIQSGSGQLIIEIDGTTPVTEYTQLMIGGPASLGGTLQATFVNGFLPSLGDSYALVAYGSLASNTLAFNLPTSGVNQYFSEKFSSTQFSLNVTSAYAQWQNDQFGANAGNPAVCGDAVVNNGSNITNLMAYALGLNPYTAAIGGLPVSIIKNYSGTDYLSFTFNRDTTATDITYTVEATSDLSDPNSWTTLATSVNGVVTSGPGFVAETGSGSVLSVEVSDTMPVGSVPSRFIRLRVTH